jgi:hypothetical protein
MQHYQQEGGGGYSHQEGHSRNRYHNQNGGKGRGGGKGGNRSKGTGRGGGKGGGGNSKGKGRGGGKGGGNRATQFNPDGSTVVPPPTDEDGGPIWGVVPPTPSAPMEQFIYNREGTKYFLYFPLELTNLDYLRRILDITGSGLFPVVKERAPQIVSALQRRGTYKPELDDLGGTDTYHLLKHVKDHIDEYAGYMGGAGKLLKDAVEWMMEQRNAWAHSHRTKEGEAVWKYEQVRNTFVMARELLLALKDFVMVKNLQQLANNFETHKWLKEDRLAAEGIGRSSDVGGSSSDAFPPPPPGSAANQPEEDEVQALEEDITDARLPEVDAETDLTAIVAVEQEAVRLKAQLATLAQEGKYAEMAAKQTEVRGKADEFKAIQDRLGQAPSILQDRARLCQGIMKARMEQAGERATRMEEGAVEDAVLLQGLLQRATDVVARLEARSDCKLELDRKKRGFELNSSWFQYKQCRDYQCPNKQEYDTFIKASGFQAYDDSYKLAKAWTTSHPAQECTQF